MSGKKFGLDKQYANINKGYLQHPVINSVKPKPKPSKLSAGGEMNQMNIKGYMSGGASRGYGAARTSGMGLQDESLMPGKMVTAKNSLFLEITPEDPREKRRRKLKKKQNPNSEYNQKGLTYTAAKEGKMLSIKQKKIARMAPPPDEITGEDFKAMKAKNGRYMKK